MKDKYNGSGNTAENLFLGKVNEELEFVTIGLVIEPCQPSTMKRKNS